MTYLRVRNLERFQHYRERRPVWVKLYQSILEDIDFTRLQDASKSHAVLLLLIASRYDNRIPDDAAWIGRAVHATDPVDIESLVSCGFLERYECEPPASTPLAARKRTASPKRIENREQITTSSSARKDADGDVDPDGFAEAWREYPRRAGSNPRRDARRAYQARLREGVAPAALLAGVIRYRQFCEATGKVGSEFVQRASTFFGPNRGFDELWVLPASSPRPALSAPTGAQGERARWIWRVAQEFRLLSPVPDILERIDGAVQAAPEPDRERLRSDLLAVKVWELGSEREERFAIKRIEERLGDAGARRTA